MNDEYEAIEEIGLGVIAILFICMVVAIVIAFNILGVMP